MDFRQMRFLKFLLGMGMVCVLSISSFAQNKHDGILPTDDPYKYNTEFDGIGPRVYVIPPPKTDEELLLERYTLKKESQFEIDSLLNTLNLRKELKLTGNSAVPFALKDSILNQNDQEKMMMVINHYQIQDLGNPLADWQNSLAVIYTLSAKFDEARALFLKASATKESLGLIDDYLLILNNLALLEIKAGNNNEALNVYDQLLQCALKSKNTNNQVLSYIAMAKLEAKSGDFSAAHNLIVKKGFPLLKRIKNYTGTVNALNELASIKVLEKSETEAKWIYLQAIDVARIHDLQVDLAISLFNLAELKNRIGDIELAIADYSTAKEIAVKNNLEDLLVEIQDGLGDAYLKLNDFKAATLAINEYQLLKTDLLNQYMNKSVISENQ